MYAKKNLYDLIMDIKLGLSAKTDFLKHYDLYSYNRKKQTNSVPLSHYRVLFHSFVYIDWLNSLYRHY